MLMQLDPGIHTWSNFIWIEKIGSNSIVSRIILHPVAGDNFNIKDANFNNLQQNILGLQFDLDLKGES